MFIYYFLIYATCILSFAVVVHYSIYLKTYKLSIVLLTLIAFLSMQMFFAIENIKGQPSYVLPQDFKVLYWIEAKPVIYMWIAEENREYPYTVIIPWSREASEKLSESESSIANSTLMGKHDGQSGLADSIEFYELPLNQILPKQE